MNTELTIAEVGVIFSLATPTLLYLLGRLFDRRKLDAERKRIEAENESTKALSRKTEAEVAQNYITSASSLVEEYKEMLKMINDKYDTLEARLVSTEAKLEKEIKNRKAHERVIRELYRGINLLLNQMIEEKIDPKWCVEDNIKNAIEKMSAEEL